MANGLSIAKKGNTIKGTPDKLYVDPTTQLLKVARTVTGVLSADGTTVRSIDMGDYLWVKDTTYAGSGQTWNLTIPYNDLMDYIPQFIVFLDQVSNGKRMQLGNIIAGVGNEGDANGFANISRNGLFISALLNPFGGANTNVPGEYGFFAQIYWDRIEAPL